MKVPTWSMLSGAYLFCGYKFIYTIQFEELERPTSAFIDSKLKQSYEEACPGSYK